MTLIKESIDGWWKPRYLLDDRVQSAVEFMGRDERLRTVTLDDIDWDSLKGLPEEVLSRARHLNAIFPTIIEQYNDGVAKVYWQLNPDGYYSMDEDGYGMSDDTEIELVGEVDREGKVVKKFYLYTQSSRSML